MLWTPNFLSAAIFPFRRGMSQRYVSTALSTLPEKYYRSWSNLYSGVAGALSTHAMKAVQSFIPFLSPLNTWMQTRFNCLHTPWPIGDKTFPTGFEAANILFFFFKFRPQPLLLFEKFFLMLASHNDLISLIPLSVPWPLVGVWVPPLGIFNTSAQRFLHFGTKRVFRFNKTVQIL